MKLSLALISLGGVESGFVKGAFHQHATPVWRSCHYKQDDTGTDADVLLDAIAKSQRGYAFVGILGNEEPPQQPKKNHGLVVLNVTENQVGAMSKSACDPVPPEGAGSWTTIDINNFHRAYIQGVPGYFWQHPTWETTREQVLAHMQSGDANLRGLEVYNAFVEHNWDLEIPRDDADIDPLYPFYRSGDCLPWSQHSGSCHLKSPIEYWDSTLRAVKRPIYGLADDDGFVYTGDSDTPVYSHGKTDVQTDTASWFRFGAAWSMVDLPAEFSAADVSTAIDKGQFYASTGIELSYDTSGDIIAVTASEPVVFGVAGGVGEETGSTALEPLNITLCAGADGAITNVGCATTGAPPAATELRVDLRQISGSFFYVRIQALVRTRYPIKVVPSTKAEAWEFELDATPNAADVMEGRVLRATGDSRRPFLVQSVSGNKVKVVSSCSHTWGEVTPAKTTVKGIVAGTDQLVAERWAWMQPIFRKTSAAGLTDPFASALVA